MESERDAIAGQVDRLAGAHFEDLVGLEGRHRGDAHHRHADAGMGEHEAPDRQWRGADAMAEARTAQAASRQRPARIAKAPAIRKKPSAMPKTAAKSASPSTSVPQTARNKAEPAAQRKRHRASRNDPRFQLSIGPKPTNSSSGMTAARR